MSKILTLTFSPSIDKSASVKALIPDKKMHCSNLNAEPGGGGVNVARVIQRLGGDVAAVFPSGGHVGKLFNDLLTAENVVFECIETKNETRENFVIQDLKTKQEFRFGMPSNALFDNEWKACLTIIEKQENIDFIIASGSLPPCVPMDIYGQLSNIAKSKNAKFIVDTSGEALKNAIDEGVYLLKPNLEELGILINKKDLKIEDIEVAARKLIKNNNIEIIVVSLGANGAMLVTKNECHTIKAPKVKVKSTVGAGDSMMAGIVFGLSQKLNLHDCLQLGIACGTATTMNLGSALCQKSDVEKLLTLMKK